MKFKKLSLWAILAIFSAQIFAIAFIIPNQNKASAAALSFDRLNLYTVKGSDGSVWSKTGTNFDKITGVGYDVFNPASGYKNACPSKSDFLVVKANKDQKTAELHQFTPSNVAGNSNCVDSNVGTTQTAGSPGSRGTFDQAVYKQNATINNNNKTTEVYYWASPTQILRYDATAIAPSIPAATYVVRDPQNPDIFVETVNEGGCSDSLKISKDKKTATFTGSAPAQDKQFFGLFWKPGDGGLYQADYGGKEQARYLKATKSDGGGCFKTTSSGGETGAVNITLVANADKNKNNDIATSAAATNGGDKKDLSCTADIPVLGWLICAIAELADQFLDWSTNQLIDILIVSPANYGESGDEVNPLKTAWSSVRIIATLLLLGVALFAIISQMFSLELISAYTLKKIIPRVVIGAVLIQLSWIICVTLIQITNTIGIALQDLIFAPFGGADNVGSITAILDQYYKSNGRGGEVASSVGVLVGFVGVVGGLVAIGGGIGLLAAAIGIIISIFVAAVTLILRKVVLVALIVVSPLAFVAWILPNTQNVWQQWWSLFSRLLIMFPLIMGLLAAGKVFAYIVASMTGESLANFFIILIAYFGPFFLIPSTFKFAGGIYAKASASLSGIGSKASTSAKDAVDKQLRGKASAGYKQGGSRSKNAFARFATGNLAVTEKQKNALSDAGTKYENEQKSAAASNLRQRGLSVKAKEEARVKAKLEAKNAEARLSGDEVMDDAEIRSLASAAGYDAESRMLFEATGGSYTYKVVDGKDVWTENAGSSQRTDATAQAAGAALVSRADWSHQIRDIAQQNPELWNKLMSDDSFAAKATEKRKDLVKGLDGFLEGAGVEELAGQDKTFWHDNEEAIIKRAQTDSKFRQKLEDLERQPLFKGKLKGRAPTILSAALGAETAGSVDSTPYEGDDRSGGS